MRAIISAKAAVFATPTARGFLVEHVPTGQRYEAPSGMLAGILGGYDDIMDLSFKNVAEARSDAISRWAADQALLMFLMALEVDTSIEEVEEFAQLIERNLAIDPKVAAYAERRLLAHVMPHPIPYADLCHRLASTPLTLKLLERLVDVQPIVAQVIEAFNNVPDSFFDGSRDVFRHAATQRGMFRSLVLSSLEGRPVNAALFELYRELADQDNARAIINAWTRSFEKAPPVERDWGTLREAPPPAGYADFAEAGGRAAYERAMAQQRAIIERLKRGDEAKARAFASEMVIDQQRSGRPEHVAKSLTNLSTRARELQAFGVSLDWAFEAAQLKSDDARAWAHVAEAMVHFGRFTEALAVIERAEPFGENFFFLTLRARIARLQRRLPEALEAYRFAAQRTKGSIEEPFNIAGEAEVLRDMGRLDDALAVYAAAKEKFPLAAILNGHAATLAECGRLEEALAAYQDALRKSPDIVGENGLASVLRLLGRYDEALGIFGNIVEYAPFDVISRCGLSQCHLDKGNVTEALYVAKETLERFPESVDAAQQWGVTLARAGREKEAVDFLEAAFERFPFAPEIISSVARVQRNAGRYSEALRLYDLGLTKFPSQFEMENGRAAMLRRLGRIDEAAEIYDAIIVRTSYARFAINAKASIDIYRNRFDEAYKAILIDNPKTEDEWRSFLLLAHIDWRTGFTDHALERLQWAADRCPFQRMAHTFKSTLAAILIAQGNGKNAIDVTMAPVNDYSALIRMHTLVLNNQGGEASRLYTAMNDNFLPAEYSQIAREIAIRGGYEAGPSTWTDRMLFEKEREVLLLEAA